MAERIEDLAASFRRELRAAGRAERTVVIYQQAITMFSAWLEQQGRPETIAEFSRPAIREFLASLIDRGLAPGTVRTRYRGLYRFGRWLAAEGELTVNPVEGLEAPNPPAPPVPILSDDELVRLLKVCSSRSWRDRRDEAIVRILLDCGLRVSELCDITVDALDLDREMVIVRGKGSKIRPVYFSTKTTRALDRWLRARKTHSHAASPGMFLGQRGPLTPDGVRELLLVRGRQAKLSGRLHPHQFRHTWAHDYLLAGGQERDLKRLAGWTSDVMLERYGASAADLRAREATRRLRRGDRI